MRLVLIQPQLGVGPEHDNLRAVRELVLRSEQHFEHDDVLLLPEHVDSTDSQEEFVGHIAELAKTFGCHVVGGSHHQRRADGGAVNAGAAIAPDGHVIGVYQKLRPYSQERTAVRPGAILGELEIAGASVLVLICADFWFADLFQRATKVPDLVLVPALSVTRKKTADYSRTMWKHMAVSRAYEFGCFVGISDWAHPSELPAQFTCGVGGLADPTAVDPQRFFVPVGDSGIAIHRVDFDALASFRKDRIDRGFFWKKT